MDTGAWLVVGLGNPGPEYDRTRHNVGFLVVDLLAERLRVKLRRGKTNALVADGHDESVRVLLAKPLTYMNASGEAVAPLARYFKVSPAHLIAVHDEIDLPFGELRIKVGGGTAGHNGVRSLVQMLGTNDFVRVRIGVGRPSGRREAADHVLDAFSKAERKEVPILIEEAADAVLTIVREGTERAQNRVNTRADG